MNSPNHREHPDVCHDHGSYAVYGAQADITPNTVRLKVTQLGLRKGSCANHTVSRINQN